METNHIAIIKEQVEKALQSTDLLLSDLDELLKAAQSINSPLTREGSLIHAMVYPLTSRVSDVSSTLVNIKFALEN